MYIIINKILTILVGLFSFLNGFSVIYRICKKIMEVLVLC